MTYVDEHAVDRYIERVIGGRPEHYNQMEREQFERKIRMAVEQPIVIYHREKNKCPVHIRDGIAAPYDPEGGRGSTGLVPTVYPARRFVDKILDDDQILEAGA